MPQSNAKKSSRTTIACNACRSRKQKCNGGKPVCTQCLEHNRPCDWPEQLKRGPAKGYTEVLENRLHETENVLLKVLSQISDYQLASTLSRDQSSSANGYAPFSRLGKKGTEYWKRFPLATAENVREWQHDCSREMYGSTDKHGRIQSEPSTITEMSTHMTRHESTQGDVGAHGHYDDSLEFESRMAPPEESHIVHTAASPPLNLQENTNTGQSRKSQRSAGISLNESCILNSPGQSLPVEAHHTSQEPSLWTGAPPIKFQKQFLW